MKRRRRRLIISSRTKNNVIVIILNRHHIKSSRHTPLVCFVVDILGRESNLHYQKLKEKLKENKFIFGHIVVVWVCAAIIVIFFNRKLSYYFYQVEFVCSCAYLLCSLIMIIMTWSFQQELVERNNIEIQAVCSSITHPTLSSRPISVFSRLLPSYQPARRRENSALLDILRRKIPKPF